MLNRTYTQLLTYWAQKDPQNYTTQDHFPAKDVLPIGIVLRCRWDEDIHDKYFIAGEQVTAKTRIYVDAVLSTDGYVMKGSFTGTYTNAESSSNKLFPIKGKKLIKNLTGFKTSMSYFL